jgi:hypothetical protein
VSLALADTDLGVGVLKALDPFSKSARTPLPALGKTGMAALSAGAKAVASLAGGVGSR